jgi:hypothetical protein
VNRRTKSRFLARPFASPSTSLRASARTGQASAALGARLRTAPNDNFGDDLSARVNSCPSHVLCLVSFLSSLRDSLISKLTQGLPPWAVTFRPFGAAQTRASAPAHHPIVCTSTESTAGRSRTIGFQLSPASAEVYTWSSVVPK